MRYQFMRFPGGKAKAFTLSYDDGSKADMRLSDIITEHQLKGTFNLYSDALHHDNALGEEDVRKYILDRGHEVAIHGFSHRAEGAIRPIEGIRDVLDCRMDLEKRFGKIIRGMAYPDSGITKMHDGNDYQTIKQYLTNLDIAYARTLGGDNDLFSIPNDWHCWMPTAHHVNPDIMAYLDKFLSLDPSGEYIARRDSKLFYLWGHSFEFANQGNWGLLEEICQKVSSHADEIWFATNIEIYDYVTAYRSLVYRADHSAVYNPTLYQLWFYFDGKDYVIESGETLVLF